MREAESGARSEATRRRFLVCEERSGKLKEFLQERLFGMLFLLSLCSSLVMYEDGIMLLLSLRSSRRFALAVASLIVSSYLILLPR